MNCDSVCRDTKARYRDTEYSLVIHSERPRYGQNPFDVGRAFPCHAGPSPLPTRGTRRTGTASEKPGEKPTPTAPAPRAPPVSERPCPACPPLACCRWQGLQLGYGYPPFPFQNSNPLFRLLLPVAFSLFATGEERERGREGDLEAAAWRLKVRGGNPLKNPRVGWGAEARRGDSSLRAARGRRASEAPSPLVGIRPPPRPRFSISLFIY